MRRSEEQLFATGVDAEPLMDRAGEGLADVISQCFPVPGWVRIFVGKGNNGGDALVAGRHLVVRGWEAELILVEPDRDKLSPLAARKLVEFEGAKGYSRGSGTVPRPLVLIDGLLGIGAGGPLRGRLAECAREMNAQRASGGAVTFAVDIPTGLDGDTGEAQADAVIADVTVTMAQAKAGLVEDKAIDHVGRLAIVPLEEIVPLEGDDGLEVLEARRLREALPRRAFDTHKSMAGRVGIVAGSRGFTGAALMCARGALRAGAGLVTLYAEESIYPILATAAAASAPEVMVKPVADYRSVAEDPLDAIAVGPGLGLDRRDEIVRLVVEDPRPMVVDADALNALAAAQGITLLTKAAGPRLLTPHPGEMARLWPEHPESRRATAEGFAERFPVTLLLKGARTVIATAGHPVALNSTGHPGMATGGMGDVLTGICAGLLGQGIDAHDSGCLGSWLLGRAAERGLKNGFVAEEGVIAMSIIAGLGRALTDLRRGLY